jgi:hypothetical protein
MRVVVLYSTLGFSALFACGQSQQTGAVATYGASSSIVVGNNNQLVFSNSKSVQRLSDIDATAYEAALKLHEQAELLAVVFDYQSNPTWNPQQQNHRLLTQEELDARNKILTVLKRYAQSIENVNDGTGVFDPEGDMDQSSDVSPGLLKRFPLSPEVETSLTRSLQTLSKNLTLATTRASLARVTKETDPAIQQLCQLLYADTAILRGQSHIDFQSDLMRQDTFLREEGKSLTPSEKREEILKLPMLIEGERATDDALVLLQKSLKRFAAAHRNLTLALTSHEKAIAGREIEYLISASSHF